MMNGEPRDKMAEPGVLRKSFPKASWMRTSFFVFAVLVSCAVAGFVGLRGFSPGDIDRSPLGLGRSLMEEGEYARAAATLRAAYRAHRGERLRIEAARALLGAGEYHEALALLRDGLPENALAREADYLRVEALLRLRRFEEASALAGDLAKEGRSGANLLLLARAAYGAGRLEEAQTINGDSLRDGGPSLGGAWLFRARLALDANDLAAANAAIARAKESGAPKRDITAAEIEAMIRRGAFEEAAAAIAGLHARGGHRARQDDPLSEYLSAMLDAARGDYISATRRLRASERWIGGIVNGPLLLAMAHDGAGDIAQADRRFAVLIDAEPGNVAAVIAAGERLIAANRLEEAVAVADRAQAPVAAAYLRLAAALAAADYDAALEAAKAFIDAPFPPSPAETLLGPHAASARLSRDRHQRARALVEGMRVLIAGEARQAARTASELDQPAASPAALTLVGELYLAAGDDTGAAAAFDRALDAAPDSSKALVGRIRTAARAGDLRDAETLLRERLAADPGRIDARSLLARVLIGEGRVEAAEAFLATRGEGAGPADPALAGPAGGGDLAALRRAYLAAPTDAAAISRYGTALAAAGARAESARVMREACFWAAFESCEATPPPPS